MTARLTDTSSRNLLHFQSDLGRLPGYGKFELTAGQGCSVKVKFRT
jgi:hypothetical protein